MGKPEECGACEMWRTGWGGSYSSCGGGKGYSNREVGSDGVPIIEDGECNLTFVGGKAMPLEPSGIVATYSVTWKNQKHCQKTRTAVGRGENNGRRLIPGWKPVHVLGGSSVP